MKMLASTVQFSSYGRQPVHTLVSHHHQVIDTRRPAPQATHTKRVSNLKESTTKQRPIPQDPTACQTATHPTREQAA